MIYFPLLWSARSNFIYTAFHLLNRTHLHLHTARYVFSINKRKLHETFVSSIQTRRNHPRQGKKNKNHSFFSNTNWFLFIPLVIQFASWWLALFYLPPLPLCCFPVSSRNENWHTSLHFHRWRKSHLLWFYWARALNVDTIWFLWSFTYMQAGRGDSVTQIFGKQWGWQTGRENLWEVSEDEWAMIDRPF